MEADCYSRVTEVLPLRDRWGWCSGALWQRGELSGETGNGNDGGCNRPSENFSWRKAFPGGRGKSDPPRFAPNGRVFRKFRPRRGESKNEGLLGLELQAFQG